MHNNIATILENGVLTIDLYFYMYLLCDQYQLHPKKLHYTGCLWNCSCSLWVRIGVLVLWRLADKQCMSSGLKLSKGANLNGKKHGLTRNKTYHMIMSLYDWCPSSHDAV